MQRSESTLTSAVDGLDIATYRWTPDSGVRAGVVQTTHGVAEYGLRYERLAGRSPTPDSRSSPATTAATAVRWVTRSR